MPTYLIADETITDADTFEEYKRKVVPILSRYGARFLSRGAFYDVLKGQGRWQPGRLVIIEFPDMERLRAWYDSPEYGPVRAIRLWAVQSTLVALEGSVRTADAEQPSRPRLAPLRLTAWATRVPAPASRLPRADPIRAAPDGEFVVSAAPCSRPQCALGSQYTGLE
jgi:uncharacterized protein (DUF1330 family)